MKIALLTDSDVFAGTERHMLDLGLELRALGDEVALVCPAKGVLAQRGRAEGLAVQALEKRRGVDPIAVAQLSRWLVQGRFDLVHAHNGRTALLAALARKPARRGALVATQHFLQPARATRRGLAALAGRMVHRFADAAIDRHIAISQAVGDALLARGESTADKLRVVLNGIRDPRGRTLATRAETRARLGVPPDAPVVVCLARLEPEKGVATLVDAMTTVASRVPGALCLIAGTGSLEESLRTRISAAPSPASSRLLGFMADSLSLLEACDVFVLPSLAEPFGLSIVEAMALGKPVIATRAGGPMEIVRDGVTGLLVAPGEPEPLASALISLLTRQDLAGAMGQAARADFFATFTARRMASEMRAVYHQIIS